MAFRYFPAWTETQLETALTTALTQQASGQVVASGGAGSANFTANVQLDIDERIRRLLHDLNLVNPTDYPIADLLLPDRTRVGFS